MKHDPATRHIPVQVISVEENWQRSIQMGALAFLQKPASRESLDMALSGLREFAERSVKKLLIIEDDKAQRNSLVSLVGNGDVQTTAVGTGAEALALLESENFDCMVLDLGLPDMSGFQLIEKLKKEPQIGRASCRERV